MAITTNTPKIYKVKVSINDPDEVSYTTALDAFRLFLQSGEEIKPIITSVTPAIDAESIKIEMLVSLFGFTSPSSNGVHDLGVRTALSDVYGNRPSQRIVIETIEFTS